MKYTADGISAGFQESDHAYVLGVLCFTNLPAEYTVTASVAETDFLTAGFWPNWETSSAKGSPVIVHAEQGEGGVQDTTLIAIDATFRGHPENTFRLIGNAIYDGLEP